MNFQEQDETRHRARKDKRKWCKGKVGVEHDYKPQAIVMQINHRSQPLRFMHQVWIVCVGCGRKTDYVGLFEEGEKWMMRKSRWIKETDRQRIQEQLDELA